MTKGKRIVRESKGEAPLKTPAEFFVVGTPVSRTDAEEKVTWWDYDPFGNLTEIKYPSGLTQQMTYYNNGLLLQKTVYDDQDRGVFKFGLTLQFPCRVEHCQGLP